MEDPNNPTAKKAPFSTKDIQFLFKLFLTHYANVFGIFRKL